MSDDGSGGFSYHSRCLECICENMTNMPSSLQNWGVETDSLEVVGSDTDWGYPGGK